MINHNIEERVQAGLEEIASGNVLHWSSEWLAGKLNDLWFPPPSPEDTGIRANAGDYEYQQYRSRNQNHPKRPPPWLIGMSSDFSKDISKIDRKLQGRILDAITEITQEPTTLRGDTVKPLTGQLQGCWRYRIGDFRLIYSPDKSTGDITLLSFASRGSAYVD